jgi:hypothetical protein
MIAATQLRLAEPERYDPPLDPGIAPVVETLRGAGIETFESCDGGPGHAYTEPTVRFHGNRGEGFRALAVAIQAGLKVTGLRRVWPILDSEPTGPWWELTFIIGPADSSGRILGTTGDHQCQR